MVVCGKFCRINGVVLTNSQIQRFKHSKKKKKFLDVLQTCSGLLGAELIKGAQMIDKPYDLIGKKIVWARSEMDAPPELDYYDQRLCLLFSDGDVLELEAKIFWYGGEQYYPDFEVRTDNKTGLAKLVVSEYCKRVKNNA